MTRVLLLGGVGDALRLARRLGPEHLYSLAGLGKVMRTDATSIGKLQSVPVTFQ